MPLSRNPEPLALRLRRARIEEARRLGLDLEHFDEEELREAVAQAWLAENAEAMREGNEWTERNGLPLERYRQF